MSPASSRSPLLQAIFGLFGIPFLDRFVALFLILLPIAAPILLYLEPPGSPEAKTAGTITDLDIRSGTMARYVHYTYEVEGKEYSGKMQWVNLDSHPEIRQGAEIEVFYKLASPNSSRTKNEPDMATAMLWSLAVSVLLWGWVFLKAARLRRQGGGRAA